MPEADLEGLARQLAMNLECGCHDPLVARLGRLLPEMLLEGNPIPVERIVRSTGSSESAVAQALSRIPDIEVDTEGRIVGAGITLIPTPHRFAVAGRQLFTWCAWDAVSYPALLQRTAQVESRCAATGNAIQMIVTPTDVRNVEPAGTVVSFIPVDGCGNSAGVRGGFCDHVHFFSSTAVAAEWLAEHPGGHLLTVSEAFELGVRAHQAHTSMQAGRHDAGSR